MLFRLAHNVEVEASMKLTLPQVWAGSDPRSEESAQVGNMESARLHHFGLDTVMRNDKWNCLLSIAGGIVLRTRLTDALPPTGITIKPI